jgi:hypothetical protein
MKDIDLTKLLELIRTFISNYLTFYDFESQIFAVKSKLKKIAEIVSLCGTLLYLVIYFNCLILSPSLVEFKHDFVF